MHSLVIQRYDVITPERSMPSSPTLSAATVTHTIATTRHEHVQDQQPPPSVDLVELTKRLQKAAASRSSSTRPRSQLFQSSKPPSPSNSSSSSTTSSSPGQQLAASKSMTTPGRAAQQQQQQVPQHNTASIRPPLTHRSASATTPSQFVFKKPEYDQVYHKTHFHHHQAPPPPSSPSSKVTTSAPSSPRDSFLGWSDLRRLFLSSDPAPPPPPSTSSSVTEHSSTTTTTTKPQAVFANQFRQDIEARYGKWGK